MPVPGARTLLCPQESFGRGKTKAEAELGCIAEALERYSLIFRGNESLVRARMSELTAIDPRSILLYSDRQYQNRKAFNCENDELFFVGEPFDLELPIDWMPATSLTEGRTTHVPAACCLMWYRSREREPELARADTVGCASGRTLNEALEHALLEWIERDAMAIWWYNRLSRPEVPIESFGCQDLVRVEEGIQRIGRKLVLLDVTTDIAIPTYVSVAARHDGTELLFAGASDPSPRVAAWKAASEVGQIWFGLHHRRSIDEPLRRWITHASIENQPYLAPFGSTAPSAEPTSRPNVEVRIEQIVRELRRAGLQSFVVNQSQPDVLLKTVRAIVPGLRHIWNRRAPGRLYDVPVALGWLESPLSEDNLNPISCMI